MPPKTLSSVPIPEDILNHPSIKKITTHIPAPTGFDFSPITSESIYTFISKSNPKKATGVDGIPAKIIKSCSKSISEPLAKLINHSFATSAFPNRLKEAQVIPVYKKKDPLDKQNYKPISILPFISKLFENAINSQLSTHFEERNSTLSSMLDFTFWINPLSTIMLMITPCLMLIQILTLSFTPCNKTVVLHDNGSISTR